MFSEFLLPLDRQFDSGLMTTANAFSDAATVINKDNNDKRLGLSGNQLPIFFLYRHAIELHFKSILTIIFRRFTPSYPQVDKEIFPTISVNSKKKRIFEVHSIKDLYNEFISLLKKYETDIKQIAKTDWTNVPSEIIEWIDIIDEADKASTMFRYPFTTDHATDKMKSAFKQIPPEDIIKENHTHNASGLQGRMIFALKNEKNVIVEAFVRDDEPMKEVLNALTHLADMLTGVNLGILCELIKSK